jgi:hypothetical protein
MFTCANGASAPGPGGSCNLVAVAKTKTSVKTQPDASTLEKKAFAVEPLKL